MSNERLPGDQRHVQAPVEADSGAHVLWERWLSRPVQFVLDLIVMVAAFVLAYALRFEFAIPEYYIEPMLIQLPLVVLIQFGCLHLTGVYSFVWRYVGLSDVTAFLKAALWSVPVPLVLRLALTEPYGQWRMPISVLVVDTCLAFGGVLAMRVVRRSLYERYERESRAASRPRPSRKPVLLVGAGSAGIMAAREIQGRGDMDIWIEGFVDDDPAKQGAVIRGRKVLGTTSDLPRLCSELEIDHVIITIATGGRQELRRIVEICEQIPIQARIIPGLFEILGGQVEVTRIRDVQIEDLLGREQVHLDEEVLADFLTGKTVMVTGAGGSIGSELARQVCRFGARQVLVVERAEFALFDIDRQLRAAWPGIEVVPLVADVGDEDRMRQIFTRWRPAVVLHAAAHKHVPLMETNPCEAVKNNVLATRIVARMAGEHGAEAFIQISTDKAVRPTSVMGACKLLAELIVRDLDSTYDTRFVSVRFGNVLGSAGSVIPIFREQILAGGPVTVTHPEMVRYFMTIPEAAQLVLEAGAIGDGGEIFVLDMGEPVRILDMAKQMISLMGLKPYVDVDIVFTGVRPGEKLFEELQTDSENMTRTRHPKIFIGRVGGSPSASLAAGLERLRELAYGGDEAGTRSLLGELLPEAALRQQRRATITDHRSKIED